MRSHIKAEIHYIRERRKFFDRVIIRVFRRVFKRWAVAHLTRAYEVSLITSKQLHDIDGHMGSDLKLPGFPDADAPPVDNLITRAAPYLKGFPEAVKRVDELAEEFSRKKHK